MGTPSPPGPPAEPDVGDGPPPGSGSRRRTRRPVVIAGTVAVVAVAAGAAAIAVIGGDESAAGCLPSLGPPVRVDDGPVVGSDLARARSLVDDPPGRRWEDVLDFSAETGAAVDPLSVGAQAATFDDPSEHLGYDWADVDCWIQGSSRMAARGSFDDERMAAADELGFDVALDGDVLTYTNVPDDQARDEGGGEVPSQVTELLEVVYRNEAVSFTAWPDASGPPADGVWLLTGVAPGEGPELLLAWAFPTEEEAVSGEGELRAVLADESAVGDEVDGDPAELLARDGSTLVLRAPFTAEIASGSDLLYELDPALVLFWDLPDLPPGAPEDG